MKEQRLTHAEWKQEAERRFGPDSSNWKFVCPVCKHVASVQDWRDAGAENAIAFSCVVRWTRSKRDVFDSKTTSGPCSYAGGGLFKLNPVTVVDDEGREHSMFEFADSDKTENAA